MATLNVKDVPDSSIASCAGVSAYGVNGAAATGALAAAAVEVNELASRAGAHIASRFAVT
jgi:hypothetical protein